MWFFASLGKPQRSAPSGRSHGAARTHVFFRFLPTRTGLEGRTMTRLAFPAVVGCLLLLMPNAGWAGSYTVSGPIDTSGNASVDPFDSSKGTLTGVSETINETISNTVGLTNTTNQTIAAMISQTVKLTDNGADPIFGGSTFPGKLTIGFSLDGGASSDFTGSVSLGGASPVDTSNLAFYEGPGQVDFFLGVSLFGFTAPPSGIEFVGLPQVSLGPGTVTVTYTYTAAPEPAALTLLGLGVATAVGYGWHRRR
jgi:hypothetical protein